MSRPEPFVFNPTWTVTEFLRVNDALSGKDPRCEVIEASGEALERENGNVQDDVILRGSDTMERVASAKILRVCIKGYSTAELALIDWENF